MIKAIIIVSAKFSPLVFGPEMIEAIQSRVELVAGPLTAEEIEKNPVLLRDVEVIFSSWGMPVIDESFLTAAPKLRVVFYAAGTVKYFMTDAAWARGIRVSSAWQINGEAVADYTLAVILFSLKQGFAAMRGFREAKCFDPTTLPSGISGSTVALISLGAAGRAVRRALRNHDLRVIAYDPFVGEAEAAKLGVTLVSLEEAFAIADVVSLHTPSTPETNGLVRGRHFECMRPYATFINTARGSIVCESELIETLRKRQDLTAILDVTDPEPPAADSLLFDLPNVVLTPHIAGVMGRDCVRLMQAMLEEFDHWAAGRSLSSEVTQESVKRMA
jgi:phosphoglycerate dehydrogenase-like enzyme